MSLYNMLFGKNPNTTTILAALNLREGMIERFRDVWLDEDENHIVIYTRTGGGNREYYPNKVLTSHPLYIRDEDDDFDSTYAKYYFAMPNLETVQPPESLRAQTVDVITDALENGIEDAVGLDEACRTACRVMELVCKYVEKHGNIALSVGSEWMYQDDNAQVDALRLVGTILDTLSDYAEEEAE